MTDQHTSITDVFHLEHVGYLDDRAVAMRAVMDDDMTERYAVPGRALFSPEIASVLAIDPADIVATVLIVDTDGVAVGHGALRMLRGDWEVKRIIVDGARRGHGLGRRLMLELERIARTGGASRLILQTGDKQPEAVRLYESLDYTPIPIYEPYVRAIPNSICFEKPLL